MKPIIIDGILTGYLIDEFGLVYSKLTNKYLKGSTRLDGYRKVTLHFDGKAVSYYVHRLVAIAFIPNVYNFTQINHKDNNRSNNCASNLEWSTQKMNMDHKVKQNRQAKGETSGLSKLKETEVLQIRHLYGTGDFSQRDLAKKYKVDQRLIWSIIHRETWKHI